MMHAYAFHEFDFSKRHCWELVDGTYRVDGDLDDELCENWREHPLKAGQSEFLRWFRAFAILAPGVVTNFEDGWLKLGPDFSDTYRVDMYCENYGGKIKAFLDTNNGIACVEVYDESLLDAAMEATDNVTAQYEEMVK